MIQRKYFRSRYGLGNLFCSVLFGKWSACHDREPKENVLCLPW